MSLSTSAVHRPIDINVSRDQLERSLADILTAIRPQLDDETLAHDLANALAAAASQATGQSPT